MRKLKVGDRIEIIGTDELRTIEDINSDGMIAVKTNGLTFWYYTDEVQRVIYPDGDVEEAINPATEGAGELKRGEDNMIEIVDNRQETPELPYFRRTKGGCLVLYYKGEDGMIERLWIGEVNKDMKIKKIEPVDKDNDTGCPIVNVKLVIE